MDRVLTVAEIKEAYPDQWVLVGNPQVSVATLMAGVVIVHGKEKKDLVSQGFEWRGKYERTMTFYTGQVPKGRRFLL